MTDEEYVTTQEQLLFLGGLVKDIDVVGFLNRISHAEAWGPIADPTLYRAAMKNLDEIKQIAEGALKLKQAVSRLIAETEKAREK